MFTLKALGWNGFFENEFEQHREQGLKPGRVALEERGAYRIYGEWGEVTARATGRLRFDAVSPADFPAVGDWVALSEAKAGGQPQIHAVLQRKSKFSRKAAGTDSQEQVVAANIDNVFLVQGLDHDFNVRRLERYLVATLESGAEPIVVLTKSDLCPEWSAREKDIVSVASGAPVHVVSSVTRHGLSELTGYLEEGRTVGFLGSSGAGKSTLINELVGRQIQKTAPVREHDSRGRHTTTHRELIVLESGGIVIDTPGMRELHLWDASGSLGNAFADVQTIVAQCHFSDCRHETEPGCAVREAMADGTLDPGRFENYVKMERELEYLDSRMDTQLHLKRKSREKKLHRAIRTLKPKRR